MKRLSLAAAAAALMFAGIATTPASARAAGKPTIVLVYGAFADASGFGAVTDRLQDRGYTVIAPANPLRGPASDAAYVASVIRRSPGRSCSSPTPTAARSSPRPPTRSAM